VRQSRKFNFHVEVTSRALQAQGNAGIGENLSAGGEEQGGDGRYRASNSRSVRAASGSPSIHFHQAAKCCTAIVFSTGGVSCGFLGMILEITGLPAERGFSSLAPV
jgi:hypothetical protein